MNAGTARGFSFIELVVAMAIMLAVTSSMFGLVHSARTVFEIDLERADMQQRARVSMAALFRDLVMAGAGLQMPAIAPFRRGDENPDLPGSAFSDRISVRYVPPDAAAGGAVTITYALRDDAAGVPQLTRYDGRTTDLPVVDQLAGLRFEYFDASGQQIADRAFHRRPVGSRCGDGGSLRCRSPGDTAGACPGASASGTHVRGVSARRSRRSHRRVAEEPESPMTLIIALISLVLLSALGTSLTVVMNTELRAAANYAASRETMYAADGALQIASRELLAVGDWNALLSSGALSGFVDGAPSGVRQLGDGSTVDLAQATNLANGEPRPWGANNPVWRLFAFGWLGPRTYVIAWVGDDFAENDGDPSDRRRRSGRTRAPVFSRFAPKRSASEGRTRCSKPRFGETWRAPACPSCAMLSWQEIR